MVSPTFPKKLYIYIFTYILYIYIYYIYLHILYIYINLPVYNPLGPWDPRRLTNWTWSHDDSQVPSVNNLFHQFPCSEKRFPPKRPETGGVRDVRRRWRWRAFDWWVHRRAVTVAGWFKSEVGSRQDGGRWVERDRWGDRPLAYLNIHEYPRSTQWDWYIYLYIHLPSKKMPFL